MPIITAFPEFSKWGMGFVLLQRWGESMHRFCCPGGGPPGRDVSYLPGSAVEIVIKERMRCVALSDKKKENLKEGLKKSGAMGPEDTLVDAAYANYIKFGVGGIFLQRGIPGFACFTEEKFIWTGAGDDIIIPYSQVRELSKCTVMLIPMGMKITYQPTPEGKTVKKRFSIMGRKKWLALLEEKTKVPCI